MGIMARQMPDALLGKFTSGETHMYARAVNTLWPSNAPRKVYMSYILSLPHAMVCLYIDLQLGVCQTQDLPACMAMARVAVPPWL